MTNKSLGRPGTVTSLINDFFGPWSDWYSDSRLSKALTVPKANLAESADKYTLTIGAPGLHKKDFNIELNGNILTVSAERENDKEEKNETYHRQEYNYSSFSRSFTLPEDVLKEQIDASYDGGVLSITLPKDGTAAKKTENKITVK